MIALLRLVEVVPGPAGDHVLLVAQVVHEHIQEVHDLGLVVDQGQHGDAEGILHLGVLEQAVEDDIGIGVVAQFDDDPHALAVGFVAQVRDAVDPLGLDQLRDLLDQVGLVDQIGELRDDDPVLAALHGFDVRHGAGDDLAPAGPVGLHGPGGSHDDAAGRKIRCLDDGQELGDICLPVLFDLIVDDLGDTCHDLPHVVGRDIGRHTDRDAGRAVDQEIGETAGQDGRLLLCLVKVGDKGDRILVDIGQHLHGDFGQTGLCVTHGRRAVSIHTAEVSVAVHQGVAHGPGLGHVDQGPVDGAVSVGVVFTHGITDDTGAFSVRFVWSVIELAHGVQDPALDRLESVSHVRERALRDDTHRVVDVGALHCLLQVYFLYAVKNSIVHALPFGPPDALFCLFLCKNYALLRAAGALAMHRTFGLRSFLIKTFKNGSILMSGRSSNVRIFCASTKIRPPDSLFLHVQVLDESGVLFNKFPSGLHLVSHEDGESEVDL